MENKHHYRNVFKSDHLGSADLEDLTEQGTKLIFTIKEVKQEKQAKVAGNYIIPLHPHFLYTMLYAGAVLKH
ncbi:MAG: hypothetical protein ACRC8Z_03930 [Empedobacter falsenii]